MVFMGLDESTVQKLETELVPDSVRLNLTRLVRKRCKTDDPDIELININRFVNIARTGLGNTIYVLTSDDMGMYGPSEFAWHFAELELVFRRPDTGELAELICDLIESGLMDDAEVNAVFERGNVSFRVLMDDNGPAKIELLAVDEIDDEPLTHEHPNIRQLIERMEAAYSQDDYSAVLHASASVFETLAKVVFSSPQVENSTFGSIFDGYKKRSKLPEFLLQHAKDTYDRRNTEPLAGHGSTLPSTVTKDDAQVIIELTKTCVRLERKLAEPVA